MKPKIIIDTDPGVDDALALMMTVRSAMFDILGVTTVCGNSTVENSTRNAKFILNAIGENSLPIYQGAGQPLVRALRQAVVHGDDGLLGMNTLSVGDVVSNGDAVDFILDMIRKFPNEVTIIAIGPLTNIAAAITQAPTIMSKVQKIIIMGGAFAVAGNMNNGAEFNFFVDPDAARIVCNFPIDKIVIPLDVCNKAVITVADLDRIENYQDSLLLRNLVEPYAENIYNDTGIKGAIMYDPLAAYYAINQKAFVVEDETISIGIDEDNRGIIKHQNSTVDSFSVRVATDFALGFRFADAFVRILSDPVLI